MADLLWQKRDDQPGQRLLFRKAYEKCSDLLGENKAIPILGRWINDFKGVAESR